VTSRYPIVTGCLTLLPLAVVGSTLGATFAVSSGMFKCGTVEFNYLLVTESVRVYPTSCAVAGACPPDVVPDSEEQLGSYYGFRNSHSGDKSYTIALADIGVTYPGVSEVESTTTTNLAGGSAVRECVQVTFDGGEGIRAGPGDTVCAQLAPTEWAASSDGQAYRCVQLAWPEDGCPAL
jgi:hypothetical protein